MSNQTIEHVHDLEAMFEACHWLLKPMGRLVLTNDNNIYHPAGLAEAEELWRRRDTDWSYIRELQQKKPREMQGIEPYAVTRQRLIREANPALSEATVDQLTAATAGMLEQEIRSLAASWSNGHRPLPTPPKWAWCRDPATGEYIERQLDPFALRDMLVKADFVNVRVRHAFRRVPLRFVNGIGIQALNKMIFRRKAAFILTAVRLG